MSTHPDILPAWIQKTKDGTALYTDAQLKKLLRYWEAWRPGAPSGRQRYHHEGRQAYKLNWVQL